MSYLSDALRNYYKRADSRLIFANKLSLNQLSLAMWEALKFHQIDPSVISRVLSGERLFTPNQLKIFCQVLNLKKSEEEYLLSCLQKDYLVNAGVTEETFFISPNNTFDLMENLLKDSERLLYEGKCTQLLRLCSITEAFADTVLLNPLTSAQKNKLQENMGWNLYLEGRGVGSTATPQNAIENALPIVKRIEQINEYNPVQSLSAYKHILLLDAYYVAGGYSNLQPDRWYFKEAIQYAAKSLPLLPINHPEPLFALRTMLASANYINDRETIAYVLQIAQGILPKQPLENRVNMLHLAGTLAKSAVLMKLKNPFAMKERAINYFKKDLHGTGIYELSDIKTQIETLFCLQSNDKEYIGSLIQKGMQLAHQDTFYRHREYLKKLSTYA